jgi:hypothetical protein
MSWAEHVARVVQRSNACTVLVVKNWKKKKQFRRASPRWDNAIRRRLQEMAVCGMGSTDSEQKAEPGFPELNNKFALYAKYKNISEYLQTRCRS